jgi:hypothetical protein
MYIVIMGSECGEGGEGKVVRGKGYGEVGVGGGKQIIRQQ